MLFISFTTSEKSKYVTTVRIPMGKSPAFLGYVAIYDYNMQMNKDVKPGIPRRRSARVFDEKFLFTQAFSLTAKTKKYLKY